MHPDCLLLSRRGLELRIHHDESAQKEANENQAKSLMKTAVDKQQSSENGRILLKIDTKVSFKCLCPWPFQSFEIK